MLDFQKLKASPEWQALSPKQRCFVLGLAVTNDPILSARLFYKTTDKNARILSHEIKNHPRVLASLNVLRGIDPKTALIAELDRCLAKKTPSLPRVLALWLKASLSGWTSAAPSIVLAKKAKP